MGKVGCLTARLHHPAATGAACQGFFHHGQCFVEQGLQGEGRVDDEHAAGAQARVFAARLTANGQRGVEPGFLGLAAQSLELRGKSCASGRGTMGYHTM